MTCVSRKPSGASSRSTAARPSRCGRPRSSSLEGLKWKTARITTQDGTEVFRFDAVTSRAALPPGDYIVEVDGNKIPFPATEGEVFEVKPQ